MVTNAELEIQVKALESRVKALEKDKPVPIKVDARPILCSHSQRPEGDQRKCGWIGRADKYKAHLDQFHSGEEYKVPEAGIPIEVE